MDLCSLSDVREFLGMGSGDGGSDTLIATLISFTSARVEAYCERSFLSATRTEYFDSDGAQAAVWLRALPVASVTSLKVDPSGAFGGGEATYEAALYALDAATGRIRLRSGSFPAGLGAVQVVYVGGYADMTTIPKDLRHAVARQVSDVFRRRKDEGLTSLSLPGGSIQTQADSEFLRRIYPVLNAYRLHRAG